MKYEFFSTNLLSLLQISQPSPPFSTNLQNSDPDIPKGITFYKSVLLNNKVILFGKPEGLMKNSQSLWTFDLETLKWSITKVKGSSVLVENQENYSLCVTQNNHLVLFGCHQQKKTGSEFNMQDPDLFLLNILARDRQTNPGRNVSWTGSISYSQNSGSDLQASLDILLTSGSDGIYFFCL